MCLAVFHGMRTRSLIVSLQNRILLLTFDTLFEHFLNKQWLINKNKEIPYRIKTVKELNIRTSKDILQQTKPDLNNAQIFLTCLYEIVDMRP